MTSLRVCTVPLPEPVEGSAQDCKTELAEDSSTALRMTCFAKTIGKLRRSHVGPDYRAQKTDVKVGRTFLSARIIDLLSE